MNLSYAQLIFMKNLSERIGTEASELCKISDCSFDEFYDLGKNKFLNLGMNRLEKNACHPYLEELGLYEVEKAIKEGIIKC